MYRCCAACDCLQIQQSQPGPLGLLNSNPRTPGSPRSSLSLAFELLLCCFDPRVCCFVLLMVIEIVIISRPGSSLGPVPSTLWQRKSEVHKFATNLLPRLFGRDTRAFRVKCYIPGIKADWKHAGLHAVREHSGRAQAHAAAQSAGNYHHLPWAAARWPASGCKQWKTLHACSLSPRLFW